MSFICQVYKCSKIVLKLQSFTSKCQNACKYYYFYEECLEFLQIQNFKYKKSFFNYSNTQRNLHSIYSQMKPLFLLTLLIVACHLQTPQGVNSNSQEFVEPTVVNASQQIPAQSADTTQQINKTPEVITIPVNSTQSNPKGPQTSEQQLTPEQMKENAKSMADKAREMAQQARQQAQRARAERQKRQEEELKTLHLDGNLSKTQIKKQQQKVLFRKVARDVELGTKFVEYLFEQDSGQTQFLLKIPVSQQVALNFYTYVAQDNTYMRTRNIEEQLPVKIFIYENNEKVTYSGEFYFQNYVVFQGQANSMYMIRVVNEGKAKLISMNAKKLLQDSHIEQTLKTTDSNHTQKTQNMAIEVNRWYQQFRKLRMLDYKDLKAVQGYIERYYSWQIIETVVAVLFCAVQIKMIQNMLKGNGIV